MRLTQEQSLAYMKARGHEVSAATFYRIKGSLDANKMKRLYDIARQGFVNQHLERIDQLELIQQEMWKNYHLENNAFKKSCILEKIAAVQPYLSAYYEASKDVMSEQSANFAGSIGSIEDEQQQEQSA